MHSPTITGVISMTICVYKIRGKGTKTWTQLCRNYESANLDKTELLACCRWQFIPPIPKRAQSKSNTGGKCLVMWTQVATTYEHKGPRTQGLYISHTVVMQTKPDEKNQEQTAVRFSN